MKEDEKEDVKKEEKKEEEIEQEKEEQEKEKEEQNKTKLNVDITQEIKEKCYTITKLEYDDEIKYSKDGYKERYYRIKFNTDDSEISSKVVYEYVKGLQWVLNYYFQGCCSWYNIIYL